MNYYTIEQMTDIESQLKNTTERLSKIYFIDFVPFP